MRASFVVALRRCRWGSVRGLEREFESLHGIEGLVGFCLAPGCRRLAVLSLREGLAVAFFRR
jgi:hypothetical protein